MKRLPKYRWVFIAIPYILAVIGYYQTYGDIVFQPALDPFYRITSSLFNAFKIYGMFVTVDVNELNPWLEAARWSGALVTTTVVVTFLRHVITKTRLRWKLRREDAVVIHGDGPQKDTILRAMGDAGIAAQDEACFQAKNHVLAFDSDSTAIRYIMAHEKQLFTKDKALYFSSTDYEASDYLQAGLTVSNTAVNCARLYWQAHDLRDSNVRRVAIVGFGHYGQRLLEQALLVNVLPWRGHIEYHVFGGDAKAFLAWRPELKNCLAIGRTDDALDSLYFHPALEEDGLTRIQHMDRIILTMDNVDDNLLLLNHLLNAGLNGTIHIRCAGKLLQRMQYLPQRRMAQGLLELRSFGDDDELFSREVILHGKLCTAAKNTHMAYVAQSPAESIRCKYASCQGCTRSGLCGDCPHVDNTWDDLTPFEKSSNIASADHEPIKRYLLTEAQNHGGLDACREALCRTEHTRWLRFYCLHNWRYAPLRDDDRRLHPSLRPYEELSQAEQHKDWWPYETLLKEG